MGGIDWNAVADEVDAPGGVDWSAVADEVEPMGHGREPRATPGPVFMADDSEQRMAAAHAGVRAPTRKDFTQQAWREQNAAAERQAQITRDEDLPYAQKVASSVQSAIGQSLTGLEHDWRSLAHKGKPDIQIGQPTPEPEAKPVLPELVGQAVGGEAGRVAMMQGPLERAGQIAGATDRVTRFFTDLAGMPAAMLTPQGIAAMVLTHAPTAGLMESFGLPMVAKVEQVFGPRVAAAVSSELHSVTGLAIFSGTEAALRGGSAEDVLSAAGHGALGGAAFGLAGVGKAALGREAPKPPSRLEATLADAADSLARGEEPTPVPESKETLAAQAQSLADGKRAAMLVTNGAVVPDVPEGLGRMKVEDVGTFIFDPEKVKPAEIRAAVREDRIGDVLGYGIPAKPEPKDIVGSVVLRSPDGVEKQAVVTDAAHVESVAEAARAVAEPGDTIKLEDPTRVIAERVEAGAKSEQESGAAVERLREGETVGSPATTVPEAERPPSQSVGRSGVATKSRAPRSQSTAVVKPETQPKKSSSEFTKPDIEERIVRQAEQIGGLEGLVDESMLAELPGLASPFTFHRKLPGEVKTFLQGRARLKTLFRTTEKASEAGGADAMAELGDRYWDIAERIGTGRERRIEAAKKLLRSSPDPEHQFLAALHDNIPARSKKPKESLSPDEIPTGSTFTINGEKFEVLSGPDESYRVLKDGEDYPEVPLESLSKVPMDKGSFKPGEEVPDFEADIRADAAERIGSDAPSGGYDLLGRPVAESVSGSQQGMVFETERKPGRDVHAREGIDDEIATAHKSSEEKTGSMFGAEPPDYTARRLTDTADKPGPVTSARNAMMTEDRKAMGLDAFDSPERRGWQAAMDTAVARGLPEKAMQTATEVLVNPRALSDIETAGLVHKAAELKNAHAKVAAELEAAKDQADIRAKSAELARIEGDFELLSNAINRVGTEQGRALASRKLTIANDFSLVSVKTRAKAAKGEALTPAELQEFTDYAKQIKEKEARIAELEKMVAERDAEAAIKRHAGRKRAMTPKAREVEYSSLVGKARELLKMGCD